MSEQNRGRRQVQLRMGDDVFYRSIDENEAVLLDVNGKRFFSINPVAQAVLDRLRRGISRSALVTAICEQFEVDRDRAEADLEIFLGELAAAQLLREEDPR